MFLSPTSAWFGWLCHQTNSRARTEGEDGLSKSRSYGHANVGLPVIFKTLISTFQNATARLVTGTAYMNYITPQYSSSTGCQSISGHKVLILTYKALNGLSPGYLKDHISLYESAWVLESSREPFVSVPPFSQVHLVRTEKRAFFVAAPRY